MSRPFRVARFQEGHRGHHLLELVSDWAIFTPLGRIDPRQTRTLREVRARRGELAAMLAASRGAS